MSDTNVNKLTVVLEGNSEKLQKALKAANVAMENFDKKSQKVGGKNGKGGSLGGILVTAKKLAPAISAAFAVREIALFGKEAVILGSQLEGIKNAFQLIEDQGKTSMTVLKEATRGAVDEMTLMSLAVQAKNFKVPLENLGKFFEFATVRAAQTGESVEHLTRSIVLGIGRKSPLILDNLGITLVRLKEAMGKVGRESASVAEISAAVSKIAEEEVGALTRLGLASTTTAQKLSKLTANWKNWKAELGEDITESKGFMGITSFIEGKQDDKATERIIDNLEEMAGISKKGRKATEEWTTVFNKFKGTMDWLEMRKEYAEYLNEIIKGQFELSKNNAITMFGDPKEAESISVWFDNATKGFKEMGNTGTLEGKRLARAILLLKNEEEERRNDILRGEQKLTADRNSFLDKYKNKLREVEIQYEMNMINPIEKAERENQILSDAIVAMTMDIKNLGLTATKEYKNWNVMLEGNKAFIDSVTFSLDKQAKTVEELVAEYMKLNKVGQFSEKDGIREVEEFGFPQMPDEEIDELTQKGGEFAAMLTRINKAQEDMIFSEEEANKRRLDALNEYMEALFIAGEEIPEWMLKMKESVEGSIFDEDKLRDISQMWSALSTAMGQVAGVFSQDQGIGSMISKFAKLASVIAAVVAAQAAFKTLTGDPSAAPRAIAAAAAAFTGIAGIIGSVTGGFGGGGGSIGYNSSLNNSRLYTEISGRDLRIILDREGGFSNRRG